MIEVTGPELVGSHSGQQDLRIQVGQVDWRRLTTRLEELEAHSARLAEEHAAAKTEAAGVEAQLAALDEQAARVQEALRSDEAEAGSHRERIAARETTVEHQRSLCRDLDDQAARHRRRLTALTTRASGLAEQLRATETEVEEAEGHHRRIARRLAEKEGDLSALAARLDHLRGENEQCRGELMAHIRAAAALANRLGSLAAEVEQAEEACRTARDRCARYEAEEAAAEGRWQSLLETRDALAAAAARCGDRLSAARAAAEEAERTLAAREEEHVATKDRHTRIAARVAALEELEQRCEGLGAGVRGVLEQAHRDPEGPFGQVVGLVADLVQVSVESAPLIEIALGEAAQFVVARPQGPLAEALRAGAAELPGRVTFLWLRDAGRPADAAPDFSGRAGVVERVDRLVETEPRHRPLSYRLLGRTWLVESLQAAVPLAEEAPGEVRFLTAVGELLEADGTLRVGPVSTRGGLISRRSELRALRGKLETLESRCAAGEAAVATAREHLQAVQSALAEAAEEDRLAAAARAEHAHKITAEETVRTQRAGQCAALEADRAAAERRHAAACEALGEARRRQAEAETTQYDLECRLSAAEKAIEALDAQQQSGVEATTEIKIELATSEERLRNLRGALRQVEEAGRELQGAIAEGRGQLADCQERSRQAERTILAAESEIAELYLAKEHLARTGAEAAARHEGLLQLRTAREVEAQELRAAVRKLDEKLHAQELAANAVRMERSAMAERLQEAYGIEHADLARAPEEQEAEKTAEVQEEIDELRRRIGGLGNVNLEALAELDELESRFGHLDEQHRDLVSAKESLEQIIERINGDSRKRFTETLETVRGHFQTLFRDLFGGGRADIVLEEGVDILESGIEIVARPPGKEPRSISLLSGGEKTMTCVALLLAIFRSRPSPFCVLDEVDAALDEANIDRFCGVLRDFLAWTQFIIVTHSKKTMTAANTIYGVTMQESGVSKQVSVRFDDVSETGEILVDTDTAAPGKAHTDEDPIARAA